LHDINVRERERGAWKLWEEISSDYPSFRFDHGRGLGILGVGEAVGEELRWLFNLSTGDRPDTESALRVRSVFAALGLSMSNALAVQEATRIAWRQPKLKRVSELNARLAAKIQERTQENVGLRKQLAALRREPPPRQEQASALLRREPASLLRSL